MQTQLRPKTYDFLGHLLDAPYLRQNILQKVPKYDQISSYKALEP